MLRNINLAFETAIAAFLLFTKIHFKSFYYQATRLINQKNQMFCHNNKSIKSEMLYSHKKTTTLQCYCNVLLYKSYYSASTFFDTWVY